MSSQCASRQDLCGSHRACCGSGGFDSCYSWHMPQNDLARAPPASHQSSFDAHFERFPEPPGSPLPRAEWFGMERAQFLVLSWLWRECICLPRDKCACLGDPYHGEYWRSFQLARPALAEPALVGGSSIQSFGHVSATCAPW